MGLFDRLRNKAQDVGGGVIGGGAPVAQYTFPAAPGPMPLDQAVRRYRKQRGINLGSWFTTEDWLATELYKTAASPKRSDFDLARSGQDARANMERHWDSWITDEDWAWIKDRGFNSVRLPIGYYHLAGVLPDVLRGTDYEPYAAVYEGAWPRILAAIDKAGQYGLGVLVDLHGVPGAQNSDGHSGLSKGKIGFWDRKSNLERTALALRFLASTFVSNPTVIGLEVMNEPANNPRLSGWYDTTLHDLRMVTGPDFPLYISDAWQTDYYAGYVGGRDDFVVVDYHLYRCFTHEDKACTGPQHARNLREQFVHQVDDWNRKTHGQIVVGEWSAALDDSCLPHDTPAGERDAHKREFVTAQLDVFDRIAGYWFWTLKTDRPWDAGWSAKNAAQAEILPRNVARARYRHPADGARDGSCNVACRAHCDYWSQNGAHPDPHAFSAGFATGWDDAQRFFQAGDELGFVAQWAKRRKAEQEQRHGPLGPSAWQWQHGFEQGVQRCKEQCWERC